MRRLCLVSLLLCVTLFAFAAPKSGTYKKLPGAPIKGLQAAKQGDVKVVEFFSLACPHCSDFDPMIEKWLATKPKNVEFERIPVGFGRDAWRVLAKAYYVAVAVGDEKTMVPAMFKAIHKENLPIYQLGPLSQFFAKHGVPVATFKQYYNSYSIGAQAKKGDQLIAEAGIMTVPTLVVDGTYEINPSLAGNFKSMMSTMKSLVAEAQKNGSNA